MIERNNINEMMNMTVNKDKKSLNSGIEYNNYRNLSWEIFFMRNNMIDVIRHHLAGLQEDAIVHNFIDGDIDKVKTMTTKDFIEWHLNDHGRYSLIEWTELFNQCRFFTEQNDAKAKKEKCFNDFKRKFILWTK